jgi:nitronate monooxygenase
MQNPGLPPLRTRFTETFGIDYPIIGAPMFLVSNVDMVVNISKAGGLGAFPALNFRPTDNYKKALQDIRSRTDKPIGVNIIVNKSNARQKFDLKHALDAGVNLFITSLGNPKDVIKEAHKIGSKVYCDVTNLAHARKVQDLGADGVIAVGTGAGGHAGPISPLVLIPWLKQELEIPVVAAGGIADGAAVLAALALGADAVSVGTRFIASTEATVAKDYKDAVVKASPEDILLTTRISGTPASVIRTPFIEKQGTDLPLLLKLLKDNPKTKKWATLLIHWMGQKSLEEAAVKPTWKTVWSAGQSVAAVHDVLPCKQIVENLVQGYYDALQKLPNQKG